MSEVSRSPRTISALAEGRLQALLRPEALPSSRDENYRFANVRSLDLDRRFVPVTPRAPLPEALTQPDSGELATLIWESGAEDLRIEGHLPSGISVTASEALDPLPTLGPLFEHDPFAQLAMARAPRTWVIEIAPRTQVPGALRLLRYFNSESPSQMTDLRIRLGEGASVTIVDELTGPGHAERPLSVGHLQIHVAPEARLHLCQIQSLGPSVDAFERVGLEIKDNAHVTVACAALGAARSQLRFHADLIGRGAKLQALGACRGHLDQHFDFWVTSRHLAPGTESEFICRNVMADSSRAVFNGNIVIPQTSPQSQAAQRNFNLLLSKRAQVFTVPKLEIAVDDVKCAHGATVSPVSEDQLFYLESRGISRAEAIGMIIDGFTRPVIEAFPTPGLQARVEDGLIHKHRGEVL